MHKNLYLFDMDGTLTPHRKTIEPEMVKCLIDLATDEDKENHIGIVTGSDIDYIFEQCSDLINEIYLLDESIKNKIKIFPCNGTKQYRIKDDDIENGSVTLVSDMDMREELGHSQFNDLSRIILQIQLRSTSSSGLLNAFNLSGTYLQYRKSLLNWCPIGRNCSTEEREKFAEMDKRQHIREQLIYELEHCLYLTDLDSLMISLGGETSIDICPKGWDKTISLRSYSPSYFESVIFMGDRCKKGENDFTISEAIKILPNGRSFQVKSPTETMKLIEMREYCI